MVCCLETNNLGTFTRIETNSDNRFLYYFMALGASIQGSEYMHPMVAVHGTFLKIKYCCMMNIVASLKLVALAKGRSCTMSHSTAFNSFVRFLRCISSFG